MAIESVSITPGAGKDIAVDTIEGKEFQVIKLGLGAEDALDVVLDSGQQLMAASLPVVVASNQSAFPVTASSTDDVIVVTLSVDTNLYATGDVLAEFQAVAGAVVTNGGKALLHSLTVLDEDDQGASIEVVFSNSATASLGTENLAVSITDADARTVLGIVQVSSADYLDLGGCRIATKTNIGLVLEAGAATTSLYVGAVIRGAATYTASGLQLTLGLLSRT